MKKGICVILVILLIALALYYLPLSEKAAYTLHGAAVDSDGNVLDSGTLTIEGRICHYLFQSDSFQLKHLELPGVPVGTVYDSAYPLSEMPPMPGYYHTFALIELLEYTSPRDSQVNIIFSEDHSLWIISAAGHVIVGTADPAPDYGQIMDTWGRFITSLSNPG